MFLEQRQGNDSNPQSVAQGPPDYLDCLKCALALPSMFGQRLPTHDFVSLTFNLIACHGFVGERTRISGRAERALASSQVGDSRLSLDARSAVSSGSNSTAGVALRAYCLYGPITRCWPMGTLRSSLTR